MNAQKPHIKLITKDNDGYFELYWSHLIKADKYTVGTSIPATPGLFELYYQDEQEVMNLLTVSLGWRSGLRSQIREDIEPAIFKTEEVRKILEDRPLFCRYTESDNAKDLQDIAFFLSKYYFGEKSTAIDSGRFKNIRVKEWAPDRLRWV